MANPETPSPVCPPDPQNPSGFMALPRELRFQIYSYLLPSNMRLHYRLDTIHYWSAPILHTLDLKEVAKPGFHRQPHPKNGYETAICRVSRDVRLETRALLYGDNTFLFKLHGRRPNETRKRMYGGGLFGVFGGLPFGVFKWMKRVELLVSFYEADYWMHWRLQRRMERLMEGLLGEGEMGLRRLKVMFDVRMHLQHAFNPDGRDECTRHMDILYLDIAQFVIEPLVKLRGVVNVEVLGTQEWFARCFEMYLRGEGGVMKEIEYPATTVTKRVKRRNVWKNTRVQKESRLWYEPVYDWKEFAVRNCIPMEENICGEEERDDYCAFQGMYMI